MSNYEPFYTEEFGDGVINKENGVIYDSTDVCDLLMEKDQLIKSLERDNGRRFKYVSCGYDNKTIYDNGSKIRNLMRVVELLNYQDEMITRLTDSFTTAIKNNNIEGSISKEDLVKTLQFLKDKYYYLSEYMSHAEGERFREVHKFIDLLSETLELHDKDGDDKGG